MANATAQAMKLHHTIATGAHVMQLDHKMSLTDAPGAVVGTGRDR